MLFVTIVSLTLGLAFASGIGAATGSDDIYEMIAAIDASFEASEEFLLRPTGGLRSNLERGRWSGADPVPQSPVPHLDYRTTLNYKSILSGYGGARFQTIREYLLHSFIQKVAYALKDLYFKEEIIHCLVLEAGDLDRIEQDNSDLMSAVITDVFLSLPEEIQSFRHIAKYFLTTVRDGFQARLTFRMENLALFTDHSSTTRCWILLHQTNMYVDDVLVKPLRVRLQENKGFMLK